MKVMNCVIVVIAGVIGATFWLRSTPEDEFLLGQAALARGDWSAVSRHLQRLRKSPERTDYVRVLRGGLLLRTGDPRKAIADLAKVTKDGEPREQALLLWCEALYQLKQFSDASQVAEELLRVHPDHPEAHRWLGAIYYDLGAVVQAEVHLVKLGQLAERDYSPHRLLGLMHSDFERYSEAIADYQRALERNPPSKIALEIRLELAKALIKQNQFEQCLKTLDVEWPTTSPEQLALKAECLRSVNRQDEARKLLTQAEAIDPNNEFVLRQVARIALDEGRPEDALPPLHQLIKENPFNHEALYELSLACRKLGRQNEADQFLDRRNAVYELVRRLVELNQRAIQEPTNPELRNELASVCDQLGKKELAAAWRDAANALTGTPAKQ